jgi:predicted PurR-regulated permease PerM
MSDNRVSPPSLFRYDRLALVLLLLGALYLAFRIIQPYLDPILIAFILAPMVHPLFRWLRRHLRGRKSLASALTCVLVLLVILGPLAVLGIGLVGQGISSVRAVQDWVQTGNLDRALQAKWVTDAQDFLGRALPLVAPDRVDLKGLLLGASGKVGNLLLAKGGALLGGTGVLLGKLVLMLFVLFFAVRDGEQLIDGLLHLSPLRAAQEQQLLDRIRSVSKSAILGSFGTAAAQGLAGGVGLWMVGIPGLFWGSVMAFASLIPVVGTALVWVPASLFLLVTGHIGKAIFLAVWCAVIVGSIDNFLRPALMRGEGHMSTLWIFFSVLGGIQLFGLPGLVYGPLVFGLCAVLLYLYRLEFAEVLEHPE